MILPASYANGFAPRDGSPLYPSLWKGCVGAWNPGLGPSGLTLRDWGGFGNHGTLTNGPTWGVASGRQGLLLDGSDDSVVCNNVVGGSSFSVSAWIRPTTLSYNNIAAHGYTGASLGFDLYAVSDGSVALYVRNGGGAPAGQSTPVSVVSVNNWVHVAATFAASTARIYISGAEKPLTGSNNSSIAYGTNVVSIGRRQDGFGAFAGSITDFRLYSVALSALEVNTLASRPGIAYEMAPRRRSSSAVQFNRRRRLLLGVPS